MRVYWVSNFEGELREYETEKHLGAASNFLFWDEEEILIIGDGVYLDPRSDHRALAEMAHIYGVNLPAASPDGAGWVDLGRISGWQSTGYGVETPIRLKDTILRLVTGR